MLDRLARVCALGLLLPLVACDDGPAVDLDMTALPDVPDLFIPPVVDAMVDQALSEAGIALGSIGDTCQSNDECRSSYCIPFQQEDRNVCTETCLNDDTCPADWSCIVLDNAGADAVSLCVPRQGRTCRPCRGDGDCPGGHCYGLDGQSICGFDCEDDDDCGIGFTCGDVDGRRTCTPVTGSCTCNADAAGDERLCTLENEFGSCIGRETCDPEAGWIGCDAQMPAAELCNQIDDDCNGFTDDIEGLGEVCEQVVEVDGEPIACAGRLVCTAEQLEPVCTAPTPMAELCNFLDDDCDGETDEGFETRGEICVVGDGACRRVGVNACSGDGLEVVCDVVPGDPADELCNAIDDDCDGEIDEAFVGLNEPCFAGEGACRRAGALRCDDEGVGTVCTAAEAAPDEEICDGVDNDCDGATDEGFDGLFEPCSEGVGACLRQGFRYCTDDGSAVACNAAAADPGDEVCNGIDDDCDGTPDEGFPGVNRPCAVGIGQCRGAGVTVCSADGAEVVCNAELSPPGDETCNGLDDDCDEATDEDFEGLQTACSVGVGACARSGVRQCSAEGDAVECDAEPGLPGEESCNGLDDDCDGQTDEAYAGVGAPCSAGVGVCQRPGIGRCGPDGQSVVCDAEPGDAGNEICNGLDDDCDGTIDEGFDALGTICDAGDGLCRRVGVRVCAPDGLSVQCNAEAGRPENELCDGLDNDCDGTPDEGFDGLGTLCSDGEGACLRQGVLICAGDGSAVVCNAVAGEPGVDICNGLDDDCDGASDEDFDDLNRACTVGEGVCRRVGVRTCAVDGQNTVCDVQPGPAAAEACNGLDDDCDGETDEGYAGLGDRCDAGEGLCRRSGVVACSADGAEAVCDAVPAPPAPAEACDYQDDDCDGLVDEAFVDAQGRYTRVDHCGACGTDCNSLWDPGPGNFGVEPRCRTVGALAQCGYDCLPGYIDADGRPENGCELTEDEGAVYVATAEDGGSRAADCGALDRPCDGIGRGIGRAVALGRFRVRVAAGVYRENVTLRNGIDVLGGHDPASWVRDAAFNTTIINGAAAGAGIDRATVTADSIDQETVFDGFVVNGSSPLEEGNAYAIYIIDSTNALTVSNNRIFAGDGGRGVDGLAGASGPPGEAGAPGRDSFSVLDPAPCSSNPGGAGGVSACRAGGGGRGGQGICPPGLERQEGSGVSGGGANGGAGGAGAFGFRAPDGNSCTVSDGGSPDAAPGAVGQPGADGDGGARGAGGLGQGGAHWRGNSGRAGGDAGSGGGGGGGGAAAGVDVEWARDLGFVVAYDIGASGGGGGSGGCAGVAGQGGSAGGGSFGVYVAFTGNGPLNGLAFPILEANEITRGLGGNGGAGGNGGGGGEGGLGGSAGQRGDPDALIMAFCSLAGGDGAAGGRGGHGGGGGGGQGGVSFDIFVANDNGRTPAAYTQQNVFVIGEADDTHGIGGTGGNSSNTDIGEGQVGGDGLSGNLGTLP